MLSGSLAQSCSLARLTVHALLAHFRLLMSDLENLRHACARAQIFQVRQQDSKGIEHSMYRKTVLTHFEEKRQHPATYGWTYSNVEHCGYAYGIRQNYHYERARSLPPKKNLRR